MCPVLGDSISSFPREILGFDQGPRLSKAPIILNVYFKPFEVNGAYGPASVTVNFAGWSGMHPHWWLFFLKDTTHPLIQHSRLGMPQ